MWGRKFGRVAFEEAMLRDPHVPPTYSADERPVRFLPQWSGHHVYVHDSNTDWRMTGRVGLRSVTFFARPRVGLRRRARAGAPSGPLVGPGTTDADQRRPSGSRRADRGWWRISSTSRFAWP